MIQLFSINHFNDSIREREDAYRTMAPNMDAAGVLVQTCNRIEFYTGVGDVPAEVVLHLFRVVSGLESSLVGEIAIQGQVKTAYLEASLKHKLPKSLHSLFQTALFVGKRVRTESGISRGAMSHSQAAIDIILGNGIDLNKSIISLVGAHKLNGDIIRFLKCKGSETIFLANKSFDKAKAIAETYDCQTMRLDQLREMLTVTDVLISATSAPHLIVKYDDFPANRPMLILDLAFPRDVDERIGALPGVTLYNLEDIEQFVSKNIEKRKVEAEKAQHIIEKEVLLFLEKQKKQKYYVATITS
jgi:glutamyl-tRNA reductase